MRILPPCSLLHRVCRTRLEYYYGKNAILLVKFDNKCRPRVVKSDNICLASLLLFLMVVDR